jgi:hypothetical protein
MDITDTVWFISCLSYISKWTVASMGSKTLYQGNHEYEPQTLEYLTN